MSRLLFIVILLVAVGGSVYLVSAGSFRPQQEPAAAAVAIGEAAPDFNLTDMSGKIVRLSDYRGKVIMLNFWATWCPPCRAEMPSMEKLYKQLAGEEFVMLAVNVEADGRPAVEEFLRRSPHSFPVLLDDRGVVQKQYGVFKFPETFVIRKDGIIDDKVIGAIDWAHPETVAYFRELTKG